MPDPIPDGIARVFVADAGSPIFAAFPERARQEIALALLAYPRKLSFSPIPEQAPKVDDCCAVIPADGAYPYEGVTCTEPKGHDGDHQAWAERKPGAWYFLASWPSEPPTCGAPVVTYREKLYVCDRATGHGGLHACSTFSMGAE